MKAKRKTRFDKKLSVVEKRFDRLRNEMERFVKPFIRSEALRLNRNTFHSQHSFHLDNERRGETKDFDRLRDFIYSLGDNYRMGLYFQCENGKFKWLS